MNSKPIQKWSKIQLLIKIITNKKYIEQSDPKPLSQINKYNRKHKK